MRPCAGLMAESVAPYDAITIDARGRVHPAFPAPLKLGGSRQTARGEETLRLANLCFERKLRSRATGEETIRRELPVCGEFHFARCNPNFWEDELSKMKACGLTIVATYLFWILHEPEEGRFVWTDQRDLRRFVTLCAKQGLEVMIRVGPFAHGEMRNGGLPDWMYGKPFAVRSNDPGYLECARRFYAEIGRQVDGLLWEQGGPIVGIQLENEFMAATAPWETALQHQQPFEWISSGSGDVEHMMVLKKMAIETGLRAPVYTATAWGSPVPVNEFLPVHGGYGFEPWSIDPQTHKQKPSWTFLFHASQANQLPDGKQGSGVEAGRIPFACCELGGGMQCFYLDRFIVPPESVQATAITSLGSGCSFLGYYVFHGGSNPAGERVFYGEYDVPRISYDFQAPIGEFGQIADSYRALRLVHLFLASWGDRLAGMQTALPAGAEDLKPEDIAPIRSAIRTNGDESFLFVNNYQDHAPMPARQNLCFRMQLDRGEAVVPSAGGFSIAGGESAILPVGVRVGKLKVLWSTAQLVTELEAENVRHVVLFTPRGARPEIALSADGLTQCKVEGGTMQRDRSRCLIQGTPDAILRVRCMASGESTVLHVLPRAEALRLSRHRIEGVDRLVVTDADAAEQNGHLVLWSRENQADALVFPPLSRSSPLSEAVIPGAGGVHVSAAHWKGTITFDRMGDEVLRIRVGANPLEGVDNVLLRISYVGDIGQLFFRGELVADNFANGAPWEIGLRQLKVDEQAEMIVKIVPRGEDSPVHLDETVPHPERFRGKSVARIDSIAAVPVYCFHVNQAEAL
jgi:beta-galactosidase